MYDGRELCLFSAETEVEPKVAATSTHEAGKFPPKDFKRCVV